MTQEAAKNVISLTPPLTRAKWPYFFKGNFLELQIKVLFFLVARPLPPNSLLVNGPLKKTLLRLP